MDWFVKWRKKLGKSENVRKNYGNKKISKTILLIIKNILRVICMIFLIFMTLGGIFSKSIFAIGFILCFLLLIPKIAFFVKIKFKITRKIKYIIIIFITIICSIVVLVKDTPETNSNVNDSNLENIEQSKEETKIDYLKENIENNTTNLYKDIKVEQYKEKYKIYIYMQENNLFTNLNWCASRAINTIASIKDYYYEDVDKEILEYNFEFYVNNDKVASAKYINNFKKTISEITIESNSKSQRITRQDLNKFYEENERKEQEKEKKRIIQKEIKSNNQFNKIKGAYQNNALEAKEMYYDKTFDLVGNVVSISKEGWLNEIIDTIDVVIEMENGSYIYVLFDGDNKEQLMEFDKGDKIWFNARCNDWDAWMDGNIIEP